MNHDAWLAGGDCWCSNPAAGNALGSGRHSARHTARSAAAAVPASVSVADGGPTPRSSRTGPGGRGLPKLYKVGRRDGRPPHPPTVACVREPRAATGPTLATPRAALPPLSPPPLTPCRPPRPRSLGPNPTHVRPPVQRMRVRRSPTRAHTRKQAGKAVERRARHPTRPPPKTARTAPRVRAPRASLRHPPKHRPRRHPPGRLRRPRRGTAAAASAAAAAAATPRRRWQRRRDAPPRPPTWRRRWRRRCDAPPRPPTRRRRRWPRLAVRRPRRRRADGQGNGDGEGGDERHARRRAAGKEGQREAPNAVAVRGAPVAQRQQTAVAGGRRALVGGAAADHAPVDGGGGGLVAAAACRAAAAAPSGAEAPTDRAVGPAAAAAPPTTDGRKTKDASSTLIVDGGGPPSAEAPTYTAPAASTVMALTKVWEKVGACAVHTTRPAHPIGAVAEDEHVRSAHRRPHVRAADVTDRKDVPAGAECDRRQRVAANAPALHRPPHVARLGGEAGEKKVDRPRAPARRRQLPAGVANDKQARRRHGHPRRRIVGFRAVHLDPHQPSDGGHLGDKDVVAAVTRRRCRRRARQRAFNGPSAIADASSVDEVSKRCTRVSRSTSVGRRRLTPDAPTTSGRRARNPPSNAPAAAAAAPSAVAVPQRAPWTTPREAASQAPLPPSPPPIPPPPSRHPPCPPAPRRPHRRRSAAAAAPAPAPPSTTVELTAMATSASAPAPLLTPTATRSAQRRSSPATRPGARLTPVWPPPPRLAAATDAAAPGTGADAAAATAATTAAAIHAGRPPMVQAAAAGTVAGNAARFLHAGRERGKRSTALHVATSCTLHSAARRVAVAAAGAPKALSYSPLNRNCQGRLTEPNLNAADGDAQAGTCLDRQGRERDARDRDEGGAELYLCGSPNDLTATTINRINDAPVHLCGSAAEKDWTDSTDGPHLEALAQSVRTNAAAGRAPPPVEGCNPNRRAQSVTVAGTPPAAAAVEAFVGFWVADRAASCGALARLARASIALPPSAPPPAASSSPPPPPTHSPPHVAAALHFAPAAGPTHLLPSLPTRPISLRPTSVVVAPRPPSPVCSPARPHHGDRRFRPRGRLPAPRNATAGRSHGGRPALAAGTRRASVSPHPHRDHGDPPPPRGRRSPLHPPGGATTQRLCRRRRGGGHGRPCALPLPRRRCTGWQGGLPCGTPPPAPSTTTTVDLTTAAVALGAVATSAVVLRVSSRRGKSSAEADAAASTAAAERAARASAAAQSAAKAEELRARREAEVKFLEQQAKEEEEADADEAGAGAVAADAEEDGEVDLLAELRKRVAAIDLEDLGDDGAADEEEPPEEVVPRARVGDRGAGSIVLERPGSGGGGDEDAGDDDGAGPKGDGPAGDGEVSEEMRSSVDMLTRMWNASGGADS
ncbi:hypothetical protein BU14_0027s0085 [Porphyra umbilicalis]|uniref:Uncharacterized protein n=1 Tax=Porphyra umbilicalis TaxID=2786 RepID=A0A1X6PJL4_PORUM|nr:hypothetical protein BU14_0027s0085 [Porphyra umbilicalis]|eukprot:OSX81059.1 hypothetical protein BU14_0027s0085 [Porphyra umbilicalis]